MSDWPDDTWVKKRASINPEKIHAIGYMALIWNACEHWAFELFHLASGTPIRVAHVIAHDFGAQTLWKKTLELATERQLDLELIEHIKHASKAYHRCRENRNQFIHVSLGGAETLDGSAIRLARRKGPVLLDPVLNDSLSEIRRVCEDIERIKAPKSP